jgi:hypothetical protein
MMKECMSGTGTDTASQVQWILAKCYHWNYFFLMYIDLTDCKSGKSTIYLIYTSPLIQISINPVKIGLGTINNIREVIEQERGAIN